MKIDTSQQDYVYEQDYLSVLQAHSLRELVDQANDQGVLKEDIVNVLQDEGTWFLLYYK